MSKKKQKYYYVIADKETGCMPVMCGWLPIFFLKSVAKEKFKNHLFSKLRYSIQKINASDLEDLILKSKKA